MVYQREKMRYLSDSGMRYHARKSAFIRQRARLLKLLELNISHITKAVNIGSGMETLIAVTNGMMLFSRSIGASLMLNELNGFGEKHITRILKAAKDPQLKMILQNMPVYMTVDDVDNNMEPLIRATVVGGFFAHRVERLNRISLLTSKHRWIWRNDPCRP